MEQCRELPPSTRVFFIALAWGTAALAAFVTSPPGTLLWAWLFPIGLAGLFVPADAHSFDIPVAAAVLLLGWFCYIYVCIHALSQRHPVRYAMIYAVLIGLLVLNVVGCHVQTAQTKLEH